MPGSLQVAVAIGLWFLAGATFWGLVVILDIQFVMRCEEWRQSPVAKGSLAPDFAEASLRAGLRRRPTHGRHPYMWRSKTRRHGYVVRHASHRPATTPVRASGSS